MENHLLSIEEAGPKILNKAMKSTAFYAEKFLGLTPYHYQKGFLDDQHWYITERDTWENLYRFKIATFSRQLGKTFAISLKASQKLNMFAGHQVGITAQNEKRAFEIYRTVKWMQDINPTLRSLLSPKNDKMSEMILDHGSRVTYYAAGTHGKSIRGATLDTLLMDEADYVARPVYAATIPTISATGGEIYLTSTPGDQIGSMFHNIFNDAWDARLKFEGKKELIKGEQPYLHPIGRKYEFMGYHYDYTHGIEVTNPLTGRPQIDIRVVNIIRNDNYAQYEREYLAKWSEEGSTYFSPKILIAQTVANNFRLDYQKHRPYYVAGIDWARMKDYTFVVIMEVNEETDMAVVVWTYQVHRKSWEFILGEVYKILKRWRVSWVVHDEKNVGDVIRLWLNRVSQGELQFTIKGEKMDVGPKSKLYTNAKVGLDMGRIWIQNKWATLLGELNHMIGTDTQDSRNQKIHAPENKFDDGADAFVLAASVIRFNLIYDGREAETAPYMDFFEGFDGQKKDEILADVDFANASDLGYDIKPSFEF